MAEPGFTKLSHCRVGIIGLGLMGGSLALDLRGHCVEIVGVTRSRETMAFALEHGLVDRAADLETAVRDCDLLVLAAPVRTILKQLESLWQGPEVRSQKPEEEHRQSTIHNPQSKIVIDLGSTKTDIVAAMQKLPAHFDPLGGHPMCGKEVSGLAHAEPGLYRDRLFILTPLERTSPNALALAHELLALLGARPLVLSAERQDALVARISHLPYVAAAALMRTAQNCSDEALWTVAASGFRDTSRVAASDLTMILDILLTNRAAVLDALAGYRAELDTLTALIDAGDADALRAALAPGQAKRAEMFK